MSYTRSLTLLPLLVLLCLMRDSYAEDVARRYNILQFGNAVKDHILFKPDMKPFESEFTVCAWVRKLRASGVPTWFSYAVSDEDHKEIQITDMGQRTNLFGDPSNLESEYTTVNGEWFHNCMSWSAEDQKRYVYIDGVLVDSKETPSGSTLGQDGILVIGNEQQSLGSGMDDYNTFAGELYKLNMYSKILRRSDIEYMAEERCSSYAEERHEDSRHIRWEDILDNLQVNKKGSVDEVSSGCSGRPFTGRLLEQAEEDLVEMTRRLEDANAELEEAKNQIENHPCPLSETITSHWDVLYSEKFFGETLTEELMEEVRESWEKIGSFVGAEITEDLINFFKLYVK